MQAQEKVNIEDLLEQGKEVQIPTIGSSMCPTFYSGRDRVILKKAIPDGLKKGDVVLYRRENSILVLHRICKITPDGFFMVGDNQIEVEGPIKAAQIKGILIAFIRKGRYVKVSNPLYRLGTGLWLRIRPIRFPIRACYNFVRKIFK